MDPGLAIHHNRDPPDEVPPHIALDEDSQDPSTLKKGMEPLSDTYLPQVKTMDTYQRPPTSHDVGLRLLSRPQDTDIDPAASFTYGKPIKITPGQFGRTVPSKPVNPVDGEALFNNVPSVRGGPNIERSKVVASGQVEASSSSIPRKSPPIEYHQPQDPQSNSRDKFPTTRISSPDMDLALRGRDTIVAHQGGEAFPAGPQQSSKHPQHYQQPAMKTNTATIQVHEQKHRLSLPNDTSVSSPQVPEHPSRSGPSHQTSQANRPMRDIRRVQNVNTPTNRAMSRSSAHGSNISKKRSGHHGSVPGTARASRTHQSLGYEVTPTTRRRGRRSPMVSSRASSLAQEHLTRKSCDLEYLAGGVVQSLNGLFTTIKDDSKRKDMEMAWLERHVEKQQSKLSQYKKLAEGKTTAIQQLEESQAQLQEQLITANQQLADRSEKTSKLEEKCRQYKEYLNSAIAEQQGLYKAANAKCEDAIKQMREAENKQKAVSEQERRQAEAARERLSQIVKSTVAECKFKEQQFTDKIELLNQKIQQQEADISRERETTQKLFQKDKAIISVQEAMTSVQDAIHSIGSQLEQVAVKVTEVASRQVDQDKATAKESQSSLDIIAERLSSLEKQVAPSNDIIHELQESNEKIYASIMECVLGSQTETQAGVQKLSDVIEDYMEDFWMKLEDREDILTELLEQTKAENEELETHLQLKEEECSSLFERLSQTEAIVQQREKELTALREEIAEVEQAQADDIEEVARANMLRQEYQKVKEDLVAKATLASELQSRLHESELALTTQCQEHSKSIEKLHKLLQQREEEALAAQRAAVEIARQEVMCDMIKAKETIQTLLNQTKEERATLQDELNAARQKISSMEEEDRRGSAIVRTLESELQAAQSQAVSLGEKASQNDIEHQRVIEQHSKLIRDLEDKLSVKEQAVAHLSKDAHDYDEKAQKVLGGLKQWAQENQAVKDFASELEKAEHGNFDSINPKFKPLFEIETLHRAIFQYCQAQEKPASSAMNLHNGSERRNGQQQTARAKVMTDCPPSSPPRTIPPSTMAGRILDQIRRVTIRSPSGIMSSPKPPSVQTEQTRRRTAGPPKSIMKVSTCSTSLITDDDKEKQGRCGEEEYYSGRSLFTGRTYGRSTSAAELRQEEVVREPELPSRGSFGRRTYGRPVTAVKPLQEEEEAQEPAEVGRVLSRGIFNRGPYNRLVEGTRSQYHKIKSAVEDPSGQDTNTGEVHLAQEPRKHQPVFSHETEMSRKRVKTDNKREKSLVLTPHSPTEQQTEQEQVMSVPSAPRKPHRTAIVGSEPSSPIRIPLIAQNKYASQTQGVVSDSSRDRTERRMSSNTQSISSQDSSQEHHQRRHSTRGNESQVPVTHSRNVRRF
ncbi:hypothetical protein VM1G_05222 [Cytospora mali]|uniref:Uncharacterized protein n=1 Tax=Cytospora mali TaxID=578113 RepID=A0A194VZ49_CYTMA|nr:hypothetical protein VM1G_05222 [Valsa mali]